MNGKVLLTAVALAILGACIPASGAPSKLASPPVGTPVPILEQDLVGQLRMQVDRPGDYGIATPPLLLDFDPKALSAAVTTEGTGSAQIDNLRLDLEYLTDGSVIVHAYFKVAAVTGAPVVVVRAKSFSSY